MSVIELFNVDRTRSTTKALEKIINDFWDAISLKDSSQSVLCNPCRLFQRRLVHLRLESVLPAHLNGNDKL